LNSTKTSIDPVTVSVAIPTYNGGEYLREAIASALAQTRAPDEIIVVDDGSTDHTRAVCESFGSQVKYFYQENDGTLGAGARGHAMRQASGDWIALLDHDDRWLPMKLGAQLAAAAANPDAFAVFTRYQVIDEIGKLIHSPEDLSGEAIKLPSRDAFHLLLRENPYCPSSAIVRRGFFLAQGVTDPTTVGCADWDLWLSIARRHPIVLIDQELTEYRVFPEQYCADKNRLAAALERTLMSQRASLHANCEGCRENFRAGQAHVEKVYSVAARTLLDRYHASSRAGELLQALPFLWSAVRASPKEVLRPRRLAAVSKNAVLAPLRRDRKTLNKT